MSDVWFVRAEVRALNDEDLRELIAYAQAQLAERRRLAIERAGQIRSDADELPQRKTDPSPGWTEALDAGLVTIKFEPGATSPNSPRMPTPEQAQQWTDDLLTGGKSYK